MNANDQISERVDDTSGPNSHRRDFLREKGHSPRRARRAGDRVLHEASFGRTRYASPHLDDRQTAVKTPSLAAPRAAWGAVGAMTMCVALLIASEFMPVSLLTPIAQDLGATDGMAGPAVSTSGLLS